LWVRSEETSRGKLEERLPLTKRISMIDQCGSRTAWAFLRATITQTGKVLNFGHKEVNVSANSSTRIIRFSTFEVNLNTGELRQRGQKVKLQEQPLQVLAALLERPGEMVSREELRGKL
jgi:DNA-binding response OmpR family regulator